MAKGALDAVKDERPFAGVHILATAILCAAGATADDLELARRILEKDPHSDAPREGESVAGAFNRHMDAAIDSINDSIREPTRVGRRARLAQDLERAGLVLMDRSAVAELIAVVHELRKEREELKAELAGLDGEDLGAELAADELEPRDYLPAATITGEEEIEPIARVRSAARLSSGAAILEYNPGGELAGDECRCNSCLNPSVND